VAVAPVGDRAGVAAADYLDGSVRADQRHLPASLDASWRVCPPTEADSAARNLRPSPGAQIAARPRSDFDSLAGERELKARWGLGAADAFDRAALAAAGGLLAYLDESAATRCPFLRPPVPVASSRHMMIDASTRESLELTCTQAGARAGSLLHAVDRTVTGAGARLLAADIAAPLTGRLEVEARLDLVGWIERDPTLRHALRTALKALPDIGRALGGWWWGAAARATWGCCAMGWRKRGGCTTGSRIGPTRLRC
jgi:DNA mismatch repair protein MutS